ncbi:MAG: hypothetical protein J0L82_18775 [Deltaproteobacteria bacterium]|nr:hypothetical protein [Deltaproteobacteria bacterium]
MQNKKTILHFVESLPPVEAGEELKSLKAFPYHMENVLRMTHNMGSRQMTIVAAGGRPTFCQAQALLLQDKKRDQENEITFVFLEDFGKPFCQPVKILDLLNEARSQGWLQ